MTKVELDRDQLVALVDSMLRDDNGISEYTYNLLYDVFYTTDNAGLWYKISRQVDATDGRFYLRDDAPSLVL